MNSKKIKLFTFLILAISSCKTKFDDPKYSAGNANFARYVAVGGSFTAGFADNALYLESQQNSYPAILASRFALVGGGNFTQPFVNAGNGLGNKYFLNYGNICGVGNSYYLTTEILTIKIERPRTGNSKIIIRSLIAYPIII